MEKQATKMCARCGEPIANPYNMSVARYSKRKYCSRKCSQENIDTSGHIWSKMRISYKEEGK